MRARGLALSAASLLVVELMCRAMFAVVPPGRYRYQRSSVWWRLRWAYKTAETPRPSDPYVAALEHHPERGWANRRMLRSREIGMNGTVSTNSEGLRGSREYRPGCSPGRKRILVLGDSFAFGEEVADDEVFPARLERLIPGLEAVNFGTGGYGHDQMLLALREDGPRYCARAVLLTYLEMDAGRNNLDFRDFAKPLFKRHGASLEPDGIPVPPPDEALREHRLGSRLLDLLRLLRDRAFPARDRTPEILDMIADEARRGGRRFGVVYMKSDGGPGSLIEDFCARRAVDCLAVDLSRVPAAAGYTHWSPRQHEEIARRLVPFVKRLLRREDRRDARQPISSRN